MRPLPDHPLRHAMVAELHARPFPVLRAPCQVVYFAIKEPKDARKRNRDKDRVHLADLLDQFGVSHPEAGATHFDASLGKNRFEMGIAYRVCDLFRFYPRFG